MRAAGGAFYITKGLGTVPRYSSFLVIVNGVIFFYKTMRFSHVLMYSELTFGPKCTFFALLYFVFESGPRTFPRPRDWRSRSITGKRKMDLWSVIVLKFTRSCEDCRCTATQLLPIPAYMYHMYRVRHHVSDLGWVDLDVPLILPSCSASSATFPSAQAESGR